MKPTTLLFILRASVCKDHKGGSALSILLACPVHLWFSQCFWCFLKEIFSSLPVVSVNVVGNLGMGDDGGVKGSNARIPVQPSFPLSLFLGLRGFPNNPIR